MNIIGGVRGMGEEGQEEEKAGQPWLQCTVGVNFDIIYIIE
jgi:hypothetical protein